MEGKLDTIKKEKYFGFTSLENIQCTTTISHEDTIPFHDGILESLRRNQPQCNTKQTTKPTISFAISNEGRRMTISNQQRRPAKAREAPKVRIRRRAFSSV